MKKNLKRFFAYIISKLPTNSCRVFLYRLLFNYKISKSKIGWGTVIDAEQVSLQNATIGKKNLFLGPIKLLLEDGASIGNKNVFHCGYWAADTTKYVGYDRKLTLKANSRISSNHYLDVTGNITLGKNSKIAGRYSQFWTHGAGVIKRYIVIGDNCYIGSSVRIKPGITIENNCIVGIGIVITKNFIGHNLLIGGNPAKIIRENYNWKK